MAKITYDDKVYLNENASIAEINKVTDDNMNEIKSVVNENDFEDITTDGLPTRCGYKVDNKDVYVKRVYFGALPNTGDKTVPSGVDFSEYTLYKIEGICKYSTNNIAFPLPFSHPTTLRYSIMVNIDNSNNIAVTTGSDRSGYDAWFNVYYF